LATRVRGYRWTRFVRLTGSQYAANIEIRTIITYSPFSTFATNLRTDPTANLGTTLQYRSFLVLGILYILGAFLFFIGIGAIWNGAKVEPTAPRASTKGLQQGAVHRTIPPLGIPDEIPVAVCDYYGSQKALKDFPLSTEDTYARIQRDNPEDISVFPRLYRESQFKFTRKTRPAGTAAIAEPNAIPISVPPWNLAL
jgi:hypothetical protein